MKNRKRVGITIFLLLVVAATTAILSSGSSTESNALAVKQTSGSTAGEAGLRVHLDPETGDVVESPEADAVFVLDPELENAISKDYSDLPTIVHADGSASIDLQGRGQEASLVSIDANGNKKIVCVSHASELENAMTVTAPTAPEVK